MAFLAKRERIVEGGGESAENPGLRGCEVCPVDVPINPRSEHERHASPRHQKKMEVALLHSLSLEHSLEWREIGNRYVCRLCLEPLDVNVDALLGHVRNCVVRSTRLKPFDRDGVLTDSGLPTVHVLRRRVCPSDFAEKEALNAQLLAYERCTSPCRVVAQDGRPRMLFELRNDVFTQEELAMMVGAVAYLEENGSKMRRSEAKEGSRIRAFGMRWAKGGLGWYRHKDRNCLGLSEEFAQFASSKLRTRFRDVFDHLDKVKEGFGEGEACIGNSPFTNITCTRDPNCRPHVDDDEYDVGFVVWLRQGEVSGQDHPTLFSFPEVERSFHPRHGDVMFFCPNGAIHCARRLKRANLLGVAFFQRASLFRQVSKLHADGCIEYFDDETEEKIVQSREDFLAKKVVYEDRCREGRVTLETFK